MCMIFDHVSTLFNGGKTVFKKKKFIKHLWEFPSFKQGTGDSIQESFCLKYVRFLFPHFLISGVSEWESSCHDFYIGVNTCSKTTRLHVEQFYFF